MEADALLGRTAIVQSVTDLVVGGAEVLLCGPLGVGKSTVLQAVAKRARESGRPCGMARRTACLGDVTRALAGAYPEAHARTQRGLRSFLRRAVEDKPAVLILDHVLKAPAALKGFLRSLRGTRTGVLFAIDADQPRDHAWARQLHLTHREVKLPPLSRRDMRRLVHTRLHAAEQRLVEEDEEYLLDVARDRPGWLDMIVERLADEQYWRSARVRADLLRLDVGSAVLQRYIRAINERFGEVDG